MKTWAQVGHNIAQLGPSWASFGTLLGAAGPKLGQPQLFPSCFASVGVHAMPYPTSAAVAPIQDPDKSSLTCTFCI